MSAHAAGAGDGRMGSHPALVNRRVHDALKVAAAGLIAFAVAVAVTIGMPKPNFPLVVAAVVGGLVITALIKNKRLELSVAFLAVYLGCINGPIKLVAAGGAVTAAVQDVLVFTVFIAVLLRRAREKKPLSLPPLAGWVLTFVVIVLLEVFNPRTQGLLKIGAGLRQQLQWVPFFLFGYLLVRSKFRFRAMFLILGVVASLNGLTSTYQTQLSPQQLAKWGPGYASKVEGKASRTYNSEGVSHVRPPGLGQEAGTGAGFGLIAVAGTFALIMVAKRRRLLWMLLALGSLAAIATGLGRIQVVGGVISLVAFALLSLSAGRRIVRLLVAFAGLLVIVITIGALFVSALGSGVFKRYENISPEKVSSTSTSYKQTEITSIPSHLKAAPFGFGLGTTGAAGGFGGKVQEEFEGHDVNAETQYNFLANELGIPGLVVWTALILTIVAMAVRRIRRIRDQELQMYLAAAFSPIIALLAMSYDGPVSSSEAAAPYFWFAIGMAAYWFAGAGWKIASAPPVEEPSEATGAEAPIGNRLLPA
jgi:MFS family permease